MKKFALLVILVILLAPFGAIGERAWPGADNVTESDSNVTAPEEPSTPAPTPDEPAENSTANSTGEDVNLDDEQVVDNATSNETIADETTANTTGNETLPAENIAPTAGERPGGPLGDGSPIYVPDNYTTIQAAVDNASAGATIIVRDNTYTENVNVNKALTIQSENGPANCIVQAANANFHALRITANYVNISGLTVKNATGTTYAGILLESVEYCNISNNNVTNNYYGIRLDSSSHNTLLNNTATASSSGKYGISLSTSSDYNNITNNTASYNPSHGIFLSNSSYNNVSGTIASNNTGGSGILLGFSSNNNTIRDNTASNNFYDGIGLSSSSNYYNIITNNTASNNRFGINVGYSSNNNTIMSNTANSNTNYGILLSSSSNNCIYNNYFNNTYNVYDDGTNIWNISKTEGPNIIDGPFLGGNYWSDYTGNDTTGGDGLGDTPYNISGGTSKDYLPLVFVSAGGLTCACGDICVNTTGWWSAGGTFNENLSTPIQAAVNNAITSETICVQDGTYKENVNVNTANLTIQSANGSANCIVQAANTSKHVFNVTADYVNISGFTVKNATGSAGIYLNGTEHCNISNNNATNNNYGIYIEYSSNNTIINNIAYYNELHGIFLQYSGNNALENNTASENGCNGISLYFSNSNVLVSNTGSGNSPGSGIYLEYSNHNTIDGNVASGSDLSGSQDYGIYLSISDNNTLSNNTVGTSWDFANNYDGIYLDSSNNNTITNNTANANDNGILLGGSSNNNLLNNKVSNNRNDGISLDSSCNNNTISNNIADANGIDGIDLYDLCSNNTISGNSVSNNQYGIYLYDSSNNFLTNNTVSKNIEADFYSTDGSENNTITNLTINSYPTTISFTHDNGIKIKGVETAPADPNGKQNISRYVNITNVTASSWIDLQVHYNDSDLGEVSEESLRLWKYNGTDWSEVPNSTVNTTANYVAANISSFSIFAPVGSSGNTPPVVSNVTLNSTSGQNRTTDNLTVTWDASDADSDPITNITNWYVDGNSITVLNMPFEATGGNESSWTEDYSGMNNHGAVINAQWNSTGGHDGFGAYYFDGNGDSISVMDDDSLDISQALTLEFWFRTVEIGNIDVVVAKWKGATGVSYQTYLLSNGRLRFALNGEAGTVDSQTVFQAGLWYHVIETYDRNQMRIYINGTFDNSTAYSAPISVGTTPLRIGDNDDGGFYFNGTIDEIRMYNRSLTPDQVLLLYRNQTDKIHFNETSAGDVWQACITPNDGYQDGVTVCSNNVTINTPPVVSNLILNSTSGQNLTTDDLTVMWNASDADNDPITNITNWYVNGDSMTVLNMPFEATGGNESSWAKDYSNRSNHGTVYNGTFWSGSAGYNGFGAYTFDGIDDYLDCGSASSLTGMKNMTLEAWVRPATNSSGERVIISRIGPYQSSGGFQIAFINETNPRFNVFFRNSSFTDLSTLSTTHIEAGRWYHIVGTYNYNGTHTTVKVYVNGSLENTTISLGSISYTNVSSLKIGLNHDSQALGGCCKREFNGTIDDVRIYNRTLTAEQIKALYDSRTALIVSQETALNDVWQACITPNDGYEDGTTVCSGDLTIVVQPVINSVETNIHAYENAQIYLIANVTDDNLFSVNFTVTDPDEIPVLDNINGTTSDSTIWNSPSFTLTKMGLYTYTVTAYDQDALSTTYLGNIPFLNVTMTLTPSSAIVRELVTVSGQVSELNGTAVPGRPVVVLDDRAEILGVESLDLVSDNVTDIFLYDPSGENIIDPSDDFYGNAADPNTSRWTTSESYGTVNLTNNRLSMNLTTAEMQNTWRTIAATSVFNISGDFDVQADFYKTYSPGTTSEKRWMLQIYPVDHSPNYYWRVYRWKNGGSECYRTERYDGSAWSSSDYCSASYGYDAQGSLRFVRTGSTFYAYIKEGDSWTNLGMPSGTPGSTADVKIDLNIATYYENLAGDWDNFKINKGAVKGYNIAEPWTNHSLARMSSWYNEPSNPSDDFSSPIYDSGKWTGYAYTGASMYTDGKILRINHTAHSGGGDAGLRGGDPAKTLLHGDFDIQVDFSNIVRPETSADGGPGLFVYTASYDDGAYIRRQFVNQRYDSDWKINGAWGGVYAYTASSDTSGKFRIKRTGTRIQTYYWNGANWVQVGNMVNSELGQDMWAQITMWIDSPQQPASVDFDTFRVNYGTIIWTYQKGSYVRGNQAAFPQTALIASTNNSVEIFDASTGQMWMRLINQTGGVLDTGMTGGAKALAADNGFLYFSKNSAGNALRALNFYKDEAYAAGPTNNYKRNLGISSRNMAPGWSTLTDYYLLSNAINDIATKNVGGTTYAAVATESGMSVVRNNTNAYHSAQGNMQAAYFAPDGTLYYANATHLMKDASEHMTADFTADSSAAISGITDIVSDSTYLYVGSSAGVSKRLLSEITTEIGTYTASNSMLNGSDNVNKLSHDGTRLYVATDAGLNEIDPDHSVQIRFWNSTTSQALPADEAIAVSAYAQYPLGTETLAVGTQSGSRLLSQSITTNSSGGYTFSFYAPCSAGVHNITVTTFRPGSVVYGQANSTLTVQEDTLPAITEAVLNSSSGNNYTSDNLTVTWNASDADGDPIKNITNWYRNNASITVLNMPFEAHSGDEWSVAQDYSGYGNDATVSGATWKSNLGYGGGGCYHFSGDFRTTPYMTTPLKVDQSGSSAPAITMMAWVYPTDLSSGRHHVISTDDGGFDWSILREGGTWYIFSGEDSVSTGFSVDKNTWQHLAAVFIPGEGVWFYKNGLSTSSSPIGYDVSTNNVAIGTNPMFTSESFAGFIDEVHVFNRGLSSEQINAFYLNQSYIVVSQETDFGEVWQACITPNDGYEDGATVCSNTLTIALNNLPVVENVTLSSTSGLNLTTDNLTVTWNASDADGDPIKNITNWYRNNASITVLNMPFEGGSNATFTRDYSGYGKDGVVYGATWNAVGGHDGWGAYAFDGVNDYLSVSDGSNFIIPQGSIALWFKPSKTIDSTNAQWERLFDKYVANDDRFGCQFEGATGTNRGKLQFFIAKPGSANHVYSTTNAWQADVWHHVVFTWDGSTISIYVDGAHQNSVSYSGTLNHAAPFELARGTWNGAPGNYFKSSIDEFTIYNRTLSAQQIRALYESRTDLIVSQEIAPGDIWQTCIIPNDGIEDGVQVCSNSVTLIAPPGPVHNLNTGYNYPAIQAAINDPLTLSGHTLKVDPGTYNENVAVTKSVTIRSASGNPEDTIVQASSPSDHVFNVAASNVKIQGFTIRNATGTDYSGVYIGNGFDNCNVSDNRIGNNNLGVYIRSNSYAKIVNNTILNSGTYGMLVIAADRDSGYSEIQGNTIIGPSGGISVALEVDNCRALREVTVRDNQISGSMYGVRMIDRTASSCARYIESNHFNNNTVTGTTYGFYLTIKEYYGGHWIRYNTFDSNTIANSAYGFYLYTQPSYDNQFVRDNTFTNNQLRNISTQGVYFYDWDDIFNDFGGSNTLNGNPFYHYYNRQDLTLSGLEVNASADATNLGLVSLINGRNITVKDSNIHGDGQYGTFLYDSDNLRILNNNVYGNGISGDTASNIHLEADSGSLVKDNRIWNGWIGIRGRSSQSGFTLENNTITNTGSSGIYINDPYHDKISNNTLQNTMEYGILLLASGADGRGYSEIQGNTIIGPSGGISVALEVDNCRALREVTVRDNQISGSMYGVRMIDRTASSCARYIESNHFNNNTVTGTTYGFYLTIKEYYGGHWIWYNTFDSNTIANSAYGFYLYTQPSYDNQFVRDNTFTNNKLENIGTKGVQFYDWDDIFNDFGGSNTLNGNPFYHYYNRQDIILSGLEVNASADATNLGLVSLINCRNITVQDSSIHGDGQYGIYLYTCTNGTLTNSTITSNAQYGVYLRDSNSNTIYNNYFNNTNNAWDNGNNRWNITITDGKNIVNGNWIGGNYWSNYAGVDQDDDGLGDTQLPYTNGGTIQTGGDYHPLIPPPAPIANFTASPRSGEAPLTVQFNDTSTGDPDSWLWDFGDGNTTNNTLQHPIHTYVNAGSYTVSLNVTNAAGSNTTTKVDYINVSDGGGGGGENETLPCACDVCVNMTGWWRDNGTFNANLSTPIQAAVDNANASETICVTDGTYVENVNVNTANLTIRSASDNPANCIVQAANTSKHVFNVSADYVNISGFTVKNATGSGKAGIYLGNGVDYCNISSNNASNNDYGVYLYSSSNNNLTDNTASNNDHGFYLESSSNNNLMGNTALNNTYGIYLYKSSNNGITGNNASNSNNDGIRLYSSSNNNTLTDNTANSNNDYGIFLAYSSNNTLTSDTASYNFYGIYLSYSGNNNTFTNNTASYNTNYGIILISSSNNTFTNNTASYNTNHGIYLDSASNYNMLSNNTASNNDYGIYLSGSSNNNITNNTASNNDYHGINLYDSCSSNTISNNTATNNTYGIHLYKSSNNGITGNNASNNNNDGIRLYSSSNNNTLTNNTANSNNNRGIYLDYSSSNNLTGNTANSNTGYGIYVLSSSNNTMFNNYFNNTVNAWDDGTNIWNLSEKIEGINIIGGPNLGGNYWSDYLGNDTTGDGLGETPYNISGGYNHDYLPLTSPAVIIALNLSTSSIEYGTLGERMTSDPDLINVTNTGTVNETFLIKGDDAYYYELNASWTLADTIGVDIYMHEFYNGSAWACLDTNYTRLVEEIVPRNGTVSFQLRITLPSEITQPGNYTTTVTIMATEAET